VARVLEHQDYFLYITSSQFGCCPFLVVATHLDIDDPWKVGVSRDSKSLAPEPLNDAQVRLMSSYPSQELRSSRKLVPNVGIGQKEVTRTEECVDLNRGFCGC
jgi:hypothetical protein